MKSDVDLSGSYINDALKCSSLDISGGKEADAAEPAGASKGSNEYIRKYLGFVGVRACVL